MLIRDNECDATVEKFTKLSKVVISPKRFSTEFPNYVQNFERNSDDSVFEISVIAQFCTRPLDDQQKHLH